MSSDTDIVSGVRAGDVLAGKYRVERVLGVGGMGVVVAAHHITLDEKIAIKFLLPEALKNPEAVGRFLREARAAVKIKSEHVARVSDVGQLENGSPYMVMEFLQGGDLAGWLEEKGPMPVEQAVDFVLQACEAMAEAHSLGIVHRDLKPANLFCIRRPDGQLSIKVLDFGISKLTAPEEESRQMTRTTAVLGTPYYMSPEQLQASKGVDARTDIWALGVILYELVTGRPPFQAEAVTELVLKIAMEAAPPVRALRADVPPGLELVLATCLQKDRERRYPNVGELAMALREFGSERAKASVEATLGTLRASGISRATLPSSGTSSTGTNASWGRTGAAPALPARVTAWAGAGVACVALVAAGIFMLGKPAAARHALSTATPVTLSIPPSLPSSPEPTSPEPTPAEPVVQSSSTPSPLPAAGTSERLPAAAPVPAARPDSFIPAEATQPNSRKPNCTPPYEYDAHGTKRWKRECLR